MSARPLNNKGRAPHGAAAAPPMVPSPQPELLDSTSDLLAVLHLIDDAEIPTTTTTTIAMEDLESDPAVLEVPDTPDRLAMARRRNRGGGSTELNDADHMREVVEVPDTPDRGANGSPVATPPRRRTGITYQRRGSGNHNAGGSDSEHIRKHARLKRWNSKALDSKASRDSPCRKSAKIVDLSPTSPFCVSHRRRNNGETRCGESSIGISSNEDDVELKHKDEGKMIDLVSDAEDKTEQVLPEMPQIDSSQTRMGQRQLRSNGYLSRCNTLRSNIQSKADPPNNLEPFGGEPDSSCTLISDQDPREQVDEHRHGWYYNRDKTTATGKTPIEYLDNDLSDHVSIISSGADANLVDNKKGKLKLDDNTENNCQSEDTKIRPGRSSNTSAKEVTVIADGTGSSEDLGWRTTHNHAKKAPTYSSHDIAGDLEREDTKNHLSEQSHDVSSEDGIFMNLLHASPQIAVSRHELNTNPSRSSSEPESESRRLRRQQKLMKGKGKHSSLRSISGESSSSVFEESEMSYLESSGQSTNLRTITTLGCQRPGAISGPFIDNDDLHSPDVRCSSSQEESCRVDDSSARARQVESDEILARQLQEQFYHESRGSGGTEETDATIAWSLQEEEDARRAASFTSTRSVQSPRDASIAHLYGQYSGLSFQHTSAQLTNRARVPTSRRGGRLRNFNRPEVDLETRILANLRRNFNSTEMDGEMRVNFLEALEAAFDNSNDMVHDFDEDDYEMLLTLDDNNHEHVGASESRINTLPQSVIQSDGIGEVCAVCLDTPSSGDVIRHLPCLHKFHKECIDTWLRRRATCPICKSGIS